MRFCDSHGHFLLGEMGEWEIHLDITPKKATLKFDQEALTSFLMRILAGSVKQ